VKEYQTWSSSHHKPGCVCVCVLGLQDAARRAHHAAVAEEKRRAVHEAAERHREEVRMKLEAKLARVKPKFVSSRALL
jgi:fatty acid/phospholipid biosynthesis enzyme